MQVDHPEFHRPATQENAELLSRPRLFGGPPHQSASNIKHIRTISLWGDQCRSDPPAPSSVQLLPRAPRLLRRFLRWEARSHPKWHLTAATLPTPEAAAANTGTIPQKRQRYDQIISSLEHSGKNDVPFPIFQLSFCFSSSVGAPTAKMGLCEHWGMPQHSNLMGNRSQNEVFKDWFLGFTMFYHVFKAVQISIFQHGLRAACEFRWQCSATARQVAAEASVALIPAMGQWLLTFLDPSFADFCNYM